jgi:hypothetical protein
MEIWSKYIYRAQTLKGEHVIFEPDSWMYIDSLKNIDHFNHYWTADLDTTCCHIQIAGYKIMIDMLTLEKLSIDSDYDYDPYYGLPDASWENVITNKETKKACVLNQSKN